MLVEISGSESKINSSYRELDDENNEVLNVNSVLRTLNFGLWLQLRNCVVTTCCIITTQLQVFSCADSSVVQVPNENSFESDLYNSGAAVLPLFPGSNHTVLQSLVKYFSWFYEHPGISKEALSSLLAINHTTLPDGNNLPNSYEATLRIIEPYLVHSIVYDANDCVIFRKDYKSLLNCPKCGGKRYVSDQSRFTFYNLLIYL